jgi:hypothetical protein
MHDKQIYFNVVKSGKKNKENKTVRSNECNLYVCGVHLATCFHIQQAIIRMCIRKEKDKTLHLQSIFTQDCDLDM